MKKFILLAMLMVSSFSTVASQNGVTSSTSLKASFLINNTSSQSNDCELCKNPACWGCLSYSDLKADNAGASLTGISRKQIE